MTQITIPLTAISIQSPKGTTRYGALAAIPLKTATGIAFQMLARAALSGIPSNAVISSAVLNLWQGNAGSGSVPLTVKAATSPWSTSTTYEKRPSTTSTNQGTQTRTSPVANSQWAIDLTALVQSWVSGTVVNNGLVISTTSATAGSIRGQSATQFHPVLVITYSIAPLVPTALHPTGSSVSVSKPTLTFQVPADTVSVQVQVDPAANGVSPGFDSGELAANGGLVDLSTTAYAGLSSGSSTQFRARAKNGLGWGAWSAWVSFSRTSWLTLTPTSPGAVSEDPSPVAQATYGGTITAWQVLLKNALGVVVEDSGWTPDSTLSYGTTKSVGGSGTVVYRIRDDVARVATPGDPDYLEATQAFTVTPSGTPTAFTALSPAQDYPKPWVHLTGTRAAIPDEVAIYRDGNLIARIAGADCFSGTTFTYYDRTVPMGTQATYTVRAIVNGAFSNASPAASITPSCDGIWLTDPATGAEAALWGADEQDQDQPELAVEHTPISGDGRVVRRRLARFRPQGSLDLDLVDVLGILATTSETNLNAWADQDAGHVYRLVLGNQNHPVILGNIVLSELPENSKGQRVVGAALDWWWQG